MKPLKRPDLLNVIDQPPAFRHAVKLLHVLAEIPGYWWETFEQYDVVDNDMTQNILHPCLFLKKKESELIGNLRTFVDDTLGAGNDEFAIEKERKSSKFDVQRREEILPSVF